MTDGELLILAIEGLTRTVMEVRDELKRLNDEGLVVVSAPNSMEN